MSKEMIRSILAWKGLNSMSLSVCYHHYSYPPPHVNSPLDIEHKQFPAGRFVGWRWLRQPSVSCWLTASHTCIPCHRGLLCCHDSCLRLAADPIATRERDWSLGSPRTKEDARHRLSGFEVRGEARLVGGSGGT